MKILAIDTSSQICGVAILEDEKTIIELHNDDEKTHSVKLMPMIDEAFSTTGLTLDDINLLVCCIGPGSFTGVRIGIATIKSFADVKNIPVVGVTSLESLAYNVACPYFENNLQNKASNFLSSIMICSLIDAKNDNVYAGLYSSENDDCSCIAMLTGNINDIISSIKDKISDFSNIVFVGNGSEIYSDLLKKEFSNNIPSEQNKQNSISLAKAGLCKYQKGEYGDSASLSPIYLRKSQAERALAEKIEITPMSLQDIEAISPNFNKEFDTFWNIDTLRNDFENTNSTYIIAKLDGEIVGFAGFLRICEEANLMNIVTKISKRNLGIGSKLLESLISIAKEQGCTSITLEVNGKNYPAIHLYEKFNFKRIGLRKKYYNNTDDAILMSLKLN